MLQNSNDPKVRKILFCALVRPILEYASNLCSPYTPKHRQLIEDVQRGATKYILSYPQDLKYADWSIKLNNLPLEFRRDISDLCLLFKSRTGAITTEIISSKYIIRFITRQGKHSLPLRFLLCKSKAKAHQKLTCVRFAFSCEWHTIFLLFKHSVHSWWCYILILFLTSLKIPYSHLAIQDMNKNKTNNLNCKFSTLFQGHRHSV